MLTVFLVIQIIVAVAMVGIILLQRNASDGLSGLSGGSGMSMGGLVSGRASANFLTKTTALLAAIFMINSLAMAAIVARQQQEANIGRMIQKEEKINNKTPNETDRPILGKETDGTTDNDNATPTLPITE